MRWYDEGDDMAAVARFREVPSTRQVDLSWVQSARGQISGGAEVLSLRPPRVPLIGGAAAYAAVPEDGGIEDDEVSGLHPVASDLLAEESMERSPSGPPPSQSPRRVDTMIDDIVPRAEDEAIHAIRAAAEEAHAERRSQLDAAEEDLVRLALTVARRVIAREVALDPTIVRGLVREGIRALGEQDRLVVRVGTFFEEMRREIQAELSSAKMHCDVLVDPSLPATGCVVETDLGSVDESIETRLAILLEGFGARGPSGGRG